MNSTCDPRRCLDQKTTDFWWWFQTCFMFHPESWGNNQTTDRWWFQTFFCTPTWGTNPSWRAYYIFHLGWFNQQPDNIMGRCCFCWVLIFTENRAGSNTKLDWSPPSETKNSSSKNTAPWDVLLVVSKWIISPLYILVVYVPQIPRHCLETNLLLSYDHFHGHPIVSRKTYSLWQNCGVIIVAQRTW